MSRSWRSTVIVSVVMVAVHVAAIWAVADPLQAVEAPAPVSDGAENNPSTAIPIVGLLVAELIALWVACMVYRRLPESWQRWAKRVLIVAAVGYALLYAYVILPELFIAYALATVALVFGCQWIAFDIGAMVFAIVIAATLGGWVGPAPMVALLGILIVYDYLAVRQSSVMDGMVRMLIRTKLPVLFVVPTTWAFDLTSFIDSLEGDGTEANSNSVSAVIGVGDFALPGAVAVSVFRWDPDTTIFVMAGSVLGLVYLFRTLGDEPAPGLPYIGVGVLIALATSISL